MIRIVGALGLLAIASSPAIAQTCSSSNIECNTKIIVNPIFGPEQTGTSADKLINNVVTNGGTVGASKIVVNVIAIPGAANGIIPASPLTHFR